MTNNNEEQLELYNANNECEHEVVSNWSGIECKKCGGWFCY